VVMSRDPADSTSTSRPARAKIRLTSGSDRNAFFSDPTTARTFISLAGVDEFSGVALTAILILGMAGVGA
jgi:hypothetical protein